MKQLLVLSGKGGTGKTTVSAAFIKLSQCRAFADCDVDAPNLHLSVSPRTVPVNTAYYGFGKACIDTTKCMHCGLCEQSCRFDAIKEGVVGIYECEGCGVCVKVCPAEAITMTAYSSGDMHLYAYDATVFSTAQLKTGSGASGKLVTSVKKQIQEHASDADIIIIDGSPGIGCPVIASISGVDMVLLVAEPSVSGMHDMQRIMDTIQHFGVRCAVCINKFDVNPQNTNAIVAYCAERDIPVIGKIPYDETVVKAVNQCRSIADYPDSPAGKAIATLWDNLAQPLTR